MIKPQIDEGTYNALDLAVTDGIFQKMRAEGGLDMSLFDLALLGPGLTMGMRGIKIDERKRSRILRDTEQEALEWWRRLSEFGFKRGRGIAPSALALQSVLYGKLGAPKQYNKDGGLTCDRNSLFKIIEHPKSDEGAVRVASIAVELRRLEEDRKVLTKSIGADGRMHTGFGVSATVTGRWSSGRDPFNEGANFHALSRRVREIFIPDRGKLFLSFDLAQAESLCVAYLSGSEWYKNAHKSGNVHTLVGTRFWPDAFAGGKGTAKDTPLPWAPDQNYYDLAKRTQHGFNYLLTAYGFARNSKMPVAVAKELRSGYFDLVPEISEWHRSVANDIRTKHVLYTPMGRKRIFLGRTWEEGTIKEAVAHVPQSTISDIDKIILHRLWRKFDPDRFQCLIEIHDSVLGQVNESDADIIKEAFAETRVEIPVNGDTMIIPAEASLGHNWGDASDKNPDGLKTIHVSG